MKVFTTDGVLIRMIGKAGGRSWQGRYDPEALLRPAGMAVDARGQLLVAESSPPKVISRIDIATGTTAERWYGPGGYWNVVVPDPADPEHVYYILNSAIGRGRVAGPGKVGAPDAYWEPGPAGYPHVRDIESGFPSFDIVQAPNGRRYLAKDTLDHTVYVFEDDDRLRRSIRSGCARPWLATPSCGPRS